MSIQDMVIRQRDWSAGEIDPDAIRRDDTDALKFAVRYARNLVTRHTGAIVRRPGRRALFSDDGVIGEFKPFNDISYRLVFVAGWMKIRTEGGAQVAALNAPWAAEHLDALVWEPFDNSVFICWPGRTMVLTISEVTGAWSLTPYQFATGIDGAVKVPFFRFVSTAGISLSVSARTGSVTLFFSANVLSDRHVGTIFRYAGRQMLVTSVLNGQTAIASVLEELPQTFVFTLGTGAGFSVGQIVETDTTNLRGEVIGVSGADVTVVALDKLITPQNGEKLVSPSGASAISSFAVASSPGATVQWDEQFVSDFRGWPLSVSKDRQRLIFTNFPQLKNAVCWSAIGDNRDFAVGANADDAMFEAIPAECQVFHVVGGYDEFAVTDRGVFYIPISVGTPLQPGSVEFRPIFSSELSSVRPIEVTEGLIFVDKPGTGVYSISATGQTARPYIAQEVNRLHRHLFNGVKSIAVSSATTDFPSRQIYAVNADGTMVVGQFNQEREYIGWLKWDGAAFIRSVTGTYGRVVLMSRYAFGSGSISVAEEIDYSLKLDCATAFSGSSAADALELSNGEKLSLGGANVLSLAGFVTDLYAGLTVSIMADGFYLGEVTVPESGLISGFSEYGQVVCGFKFDWILHPLFTNFEGGQPVGQGEQKRKIEKMLITVRDTQEFQCGNRIFGSHRAGEDTADPVPERDATYRYRELGRSYDPVVELRSTFPCAFKLIEMTTRITV